MESPTIYLCGPMANCSDEECMGWRNKVMNELGHKYKFLNPMVRDYRNKPTNTIEIATEIVESDLQDIDNSDIILAYINRTSTGTSMEICYAHNEDKHVIVVCDKERPSPWLLYHSDLFFTSLDEAIKYLKDENGK